MRHGSLSAAARELCVTPAAVSHRLKELETDAGRPLLSRSRGRFLPTEAGSHLAAVLGDAFARIRAADAVLRNLNTAPSLKVVAPMTFTVLWLLPRLSGFEALHPDVTPYVAAANDPMRRDGDLADIRIAHTVGRPGPDWQMLVRETVAIAYAPGSEAEDVTDLRNLAKLRAVHIDNPDGQYNGTLNWRDWLAAKGLDMPVPPGPHVNAEHSAADIAAHGSAIMLASLFTSATHFAGGRLKAASGSAVQTDIAYWVSIERPNATAQAFLDWLKAEVASHQAGDMRVGLVQAGEEPQVSADQS